MSKDVEQELRTKVATLSMMLAVAQADRWKLVTRAQQAEEMSALLQQSDPNAEQVAQLIIRHMEQSHAMLAQHQMNLIKTTAVTLAQGLELPEADLREIVKTCCAGLQRALQTMQQIKFDENADHATLRSNHQRGA